MAAQEAGKPVRAGEDLIVDQRVARILPELGAAAAGPRISAWLRYSRAQTLRWIQVDLGLAASAGGGARLATVC
jgi:hypothetical protein